MITYIHGKKFKYVVVNENGKQLWKFYTRKVAIAYAYFTKTIVLNINKYNNNG